MRDSHAVTQVLDPAVHSIFALGRSLFCIGTTEVMVSGLLPMLSREFERTDIVDFCSSAFFKL